MASVELRQVRFSYDARTSVLAGVDLHIRSGEFVCVLGRSGCGKTTLLRLIAGLERAQAGEILVGGRRVNAPGTDRALVFQNDALFPWMSARRNVAFAARQAHPELTRRQADARAEALLARVGLAEDAGRYPSALSGGMRQRAALARALAMDAEVLLLDEPFAALDACSRAQARALLLRLWIEGEWRRTVIMVTHDLAEAAALADRIVFLTPGRVAAELPVTLPRPRQESSEPMRALRHRLLDLYEPDGEAAQ